MKLVILGAGGFLPTEEAQTACYMLPEPGVLLDAGSGLYRLSRYLQTPSLDIYLSHTHADHTSGLDYLFASIFKNMVAGLKAPVSEEQIRSLVKRANEFLSGVRVHVAETTLATLKKKYSFRLDWRPLQVEETLPGGGVLTHFVFDPTREEIGFRLDWPGHSLAYVTDTIARPEAPYIEKIAGVDLLLHECSGPGSMSKVMEQLNHSHMTAVARVAAQAHVKRLILIHKDPLGWEVDRDLPTASQIFPFIEIGQDGMEIDF